MLVLTASLLIGTYLVSPLFFVASLLLFLAPAAFSVAQSAKNNNITHVHTVMLNVRRWHDDDPSGCAFYCSDARPELRTIHELVTALDREPEV